MTYISNKDFFLEVSKGNISKHSRVNKSGINLDIDTATDPEDIISQGGTFTPPTTARIHNIASTDVNDASAGTGARTITIQGLDGSYNYASETVILNGTSNVATVNSYVIIDYMAVLTFGSTGNNIGVITATAQTDATVTTEMPIGYNQNQMAVFQIRNGYKAYLNSYYSSMNQSTASSTAVVHLMTKTDTGAWLVRRVMFLNNAGNNSISQKIKPPLELQAKTLIKLRIFEVSNNNTMVSGGFDLTLVQD